MMKEKWNEAYRKVISLYQFQPNIYEGWIFKGNSVSGGAVEIDLSISKYNYFKMEGDVTLSLTKPQLGQIYILKIEITDNGFNLTFPDNFRWASQFTNSKGINYIQFLYTTEDNIHFYYDVLSTIEGLTSG